MLGTSSDRRAINIRNYPCVNVLNQSGEFFGEYSCLMGRKRACSVTSLNCSEVYILTKKILEEAFAKWPELAKELHDMGATSAPHL